MSANTNIVVSNVRFPKDEWLQLKAAANAHGFSVNEYFKYLSNMDSIRMITGSKRIDKAKTGYEALEELGGLISRSKGKGMGASEEDKAIYDIE